MNDLVVNIQFGLLRIVADSDVLGRWAGALVSGAYKLGNETLRSGDDVYDAFGVLADINHGEWVWDEFEDAWAIEGDVYGLSLATLRRWLQVEPTTTDTQLNQFIQQIQKVAPGDGKPLARVLSSLAAQEATFCATEDLLRRQAGRQPMLQYREAGLVASNKMLRW